MKTKFGKIKVLAHRLMNWESIPVFKDKKTNRMIEEHFARIVEAKTKRKHT